MTKLWHLLPLLLSLCWAALGAEYRVAASTDYFVLHTADGSFSGGKGFLNALDERIDALQRKCGNYPRARAEIFVVPDRRAYQELARGKNPIVEFSDAFYSSADRRIYLRSPDQIWENYSDLILHEYTHWYLDELLAGAPLWFHEGLATQNARQLGVDRYFYYIRERFWGNKMDLVKLAWNYPSERRDWEMYYLSSFFAVDYMQREFPEAWRDFWLSVARQNSYGVRADFLFSFDQAYHLDLESFNRKFAAASRSQAWIYLFIGVNSLIFALLPFAVIYGVIRHRRRMRLLPDLEEEPEEETEEEPAPGE